MRKSRTINLLLLGGSILSFSMCVCAGCGRHNQPSARAPYDPAWHDAQGNPIAKEWKTDENGKRVPVQPAFDAAGKPIQFDENGNPVAPAGYYTTSSTSGSHYHRSGGGWWPYIFAGRSSSSYGPTYRSGPTNTGGTYFGGSKPGSSSAPSSSRPGGSSSSSGSVSRGGFGGSASHASGGSSS
jgi:hypothetical protein